jgi:hypothetical protein
MCGTTVILTPGNLVMMMNLRATHVTLLCVLGGLTGCLQPEKVADDDSSGTSSSSSGTTTTATTDATSTTDVSTGSVTATSSTTAVTGSCGDGVVDDAEQCDDAGANADDAACTSACIRNVCGDGLLWAGHEDCDDGAGNADSAMCTSTCDLATCGDAKVQDGVEVCDDGINDGAYGSCVADCSAQAAHCGDGVIDVQEECDSEDPSCLGSCLVATSCLRVHEADPELASGLRTIYPLDPAQGVEVYCDMVSDGGGYTFLKVDVDSDLNDLPYPAKKAETVCATYGMHLFVPRSAEHLTAAYGVATSDNVAPQGGGIKALGPDYLQILGIYPLKAGVSCIGKPLVPDNCPQWVASDGGPWYVSKVVANASEPDPSDACLGCSMIYTWNPDSSVKSYKTLPAPGGSSLRFMCDVGDKRP